MIKSIRVLCPYCDHDFQTPRPLDELSEPLEVECVPYTRDVGRFDPKGEEDWFNPDKWSHIGKDFLPWLNYQKIGILRVPERNINVQYRVQRCPNCECLFDVYLNYSEKYPFQKLWPHVFKRKPGHPKEIVPYFGESWPVWLVRKLGDLLRSKFMGVAFFAALMICLGLLPYSLSGFPPEKPIILCVIASVTIIITLLLIERYVHFIENTKGFIALLKVKNPAFGIVHWRNYILCRIVGVQDGKLPRLNQVDIFSGGVSVLLMLVMWIIQNQSSLKGLLWLVSSIVVAGVVILLRMKYKIESTVWKILLGLSVILLVVGLGFVFVKFFELTVLGLAYIAELIFWLVFAYIIGVAGFLSLNTSFYVLEGLMRIPMNLQPFNKFRDAKPLRTLQGFSTNILLVFFISFLAMFYFISPDLQSKIIIDIKFPWIIDWLRLIIIFVFAAAGLALKRGDYIGIAVIYTALLFIPFSKPVDFGNGFLLDPRLIIIGLFFSLIVGYQLIKDNSLISNLLVSAKGKELELIDEKIRILVDRIGQIGTDSDKKPAAGNDRRKTRRQDLPSTASIDTLLDFRDRIDRVPTHQIGLGQLPKFLAPVLSSVFLPFLINLVSSKVWDIIVGH